MLKFSDLSNLNIDFTELTPRNITIIHRVVTSLLVICFAFFAAKIVTTSFKVFLASIKMQPQTSRYMDVQKSTKAKKNDFAEYEVVITRNLFNSKNEIPDDDLLDASADSSEYAQKTRLDIELVGTIVVNDSSRSVAAILIKKDKEVLPFLINDTILSKATVVNIARKKVFLKNISTGEIEYIEMEEDNAQGLTTSAVSGPGIRHLNEDHILVEKSEVNRALENINDLLTQARAVPHIENGNVVGFRIFGIKPGSLYERLGAKNGDIIKRVNGVDIKDPASAMGLYQQLGTASKFELNFERSGENRTTTIDIR